MSDTYLVLEPSAEVMVLLMAGIIRPRSRVLVVGAYRGDDAVYLATGGCSVTALDISPAATSYARALAKSFRVLLQRPSRKRGVHVVNRDVSAIRGFEENSFDLVWDRLVTSNLPHRKAQLFVEDVARLLRDGGLFYTAGGTDPNAALSAREESLPRGLHLNKWFSPFEYRDASGHIRTARPTLMPLYPARNADFAHNGTCCLLERKRRRGT